MLQSGCVCCTIRGELSTAIKDLHSRRERGLLPPFRRLVIESTGLADPFPILSTVRSDPVLRHHFSLGNVITTVDAVNGARTARRATRKRQAGRGGRSAGADQDRPRDRRSRRPPDRGGCVTSIRTRRSGVAPKTISMQRRCFQASDASSAWQPADSHGHTPDDHHRHADDIRTLALSLDEPVDWTRFGIWLTMLLHRHGDAVVAGKRHPQRRRRGNAGSGACGAASRASAAASGRLARRGSALASGIHRPGARSGGDRALVPRLQRAAANGS